MNVLRLYFFRTLTTALVGLLIYHACFKERESNLSSDQLLERVPGTDEQVFLIQAKLLVGAEQFSKQAPSSPGLLDSIGKASIAQLLLQPIPAGESSPAHRYLLRKKVILAKFLGFDEAVKIQSERLQKLEPFNSDSEKFLDELVLRGLNRSIQQDKPLYSQDEIQFLEKELEWFAGILRLQDTLAETERGLIESALYGEAEDSFRKLLAAVGGGTILGLLSIGGFLYLFYRYVSGKMPSYFKPDLEGADYYLEVFCIYLGAMFTLPFFIGWMQRHGAKISPIAFHVIAILGLGLLIFWPLIWGSSWEKIREALGLKFGGIKKFITDLVVGPFTYMSSWTVLFIVLISYSLLLTKLNVDITQGAHPIIPIILKSGDKRQELMIILLAVIVAPLIEEIMFRGAFYGWLRARLKPIAAMLLSSFIFAAIHPQGVIGILPLMTIGMILAFLREWRGSLLAPFLAHACFNGGTLLLVFQMLR